MSVLFLVIPIALLASAAAAIAFVWAIRRGQLDDLTTPAYRMLEEDQHTSAPTARVCATACAKETASAAPVTAPTDPSSL